MSRESVQHYAAGAAALKEAIQGLSPADFAATPIPGTWSIGQIVIHLMDSDLIASDRMKRIIAEDNPTLIGYNETAFAQKLFCDQQDPHTAAEIFRLNRELTAVVLCNLPDEAFSRAGMHNEAGRVTLAYMVDHYVEHLAHHLAFIRKKRALLGK